MKTLNTAIKENMPQYNLRSNNRLYMDDIYVGRFSISIDKGIQFFSIFSFVRNEIKNFAEKVNLGIDIVETKWED